MQGNQTRSGTLCLDCQSAFKSFYTDIKSLEQPNVKEELRQKNDSYCKSTVIEAMQHTKELKRWETAQRQSSPLAPQKSNQLVLGKDAKALQWGKKSF